MFVLGKFVPVAYGVQKLQISCVVEDDKVGTEFLEEKITEFEDFVSFILSLCFDSFLFLILDPLMSYFSLCLRRRMWPSG